MSLNVLVVEGNYDKEFIQHLCDKILGSEKVKVQLQTPTQLGARNDGWRGLIDTLVIPLKRLDGGSIDKLGIIIDADFTGDNSGGVSERYNIVIDKIQSVIRDESLGISGYNFPKTPTFDDGNIFSHSKGLAGIGLWIMPDHRHDGMLEHFIENLIINDENQDSLKNHSIEVVGKLPTYLFNKTTQTKKAELNSWLSWQEKPGQLLNLIDNKTLDISKNPKFIAWLHKVFN